jgi:hypothetical protein
MKWMADVGWIVVVRGSRMVDMNGGGGPATGPNLRVCLVAVRMSVMRGKPSVRVSSPRPMTW